ncbi:MAG: chain-length determining protein, partial [Bacteroidales bacterium]|nr:chain-length determining protein [Bacteroidales bacterium]
MQERNYNAPYQDPHYYEDDEIDIMELVRKALKNWKFILKCCGVAVVVGIVAGFSIPKTYTVSATLAPETVSKSGGGSLSSLAAMAGINLSSSTTADAFYPDLYP